MTSPRPTTDPGTNPSTGAGTDPGTAPGAGTRSRRELRASAHRPSGAARVLALAGRLLAGAALALVLLVACVALVIPKVGGAVPLTVLSNSIAPSMPVGSLAVVRPTMDTLTGTAEALTPEEIDAVNDVEDIRTGDVIVFAPEADRELLVIHRVVGLTVDSAGRRTFTTQGDNNTALDDPVAAHQVRAVLWYHVPWLGHVNDSLSGNTRRTVAVVVAGMGYAWAATLLVRAVRRRPAPGDDARTPARATPAQATAMHRSWGVGVPLHPDGLLRSPARRSMGGGGTPLSDPNGGSW